MTWLMLLYVVVLAVTGFLVWCGITSTGQAREDKRVGRLLRTKR